MSDINLLPVGILTYIINETLEHISITSFVCRRWHDITRNNKYTKISFMYILSRNNINLLRWFCENYLRQHTSIMNIEYDNLQYFGYDKMNNFLIKHKKYCHVVYRYPTNILYIDGYGNNPYLDYENERLRRIIKKHKTNEKYINHNRDYELNEINIKLLIKQSNKEFVKQLKEKNRSAENSCKNS